MPPKRRTPLHQNNNNNINSIKRNSQSTRKKNAGVNSLPIRENANIANIVSSLSTEEEEESTLESFIEITDLESRNVVLKRKELSEDLDFEITKKPKTIIGSL
jgi:hypothetical protein